jgi:hypothetical protein
MSRARASATRPTSSLSVNSGKGCVPPIQERLLTEGFRWKVGIRKGVHGSEWIRDLKEAKDPKHFECARCYRNGIVSQFGSAQTMNDAMV